MRIEWDLSKAAANIKKHRVSFEVAATVFDDPYAISIEDHGSSHEERWVTIGLAADERTLVVIHTWRDTTDKELIRIISARRATKREAKQYEEGI
ncbi:MAG: BrnT family toxin [Deltaproteobacteria bacterium]|nr:BrnT family toxin [Deltaproteobacteria bacterium]